MLTDLSFLFQKPAPRPKKARTNVEPPRTQSLSPKVYLLNIGRGVNGPVVVGETYTFFDTVVSPTIINLQTKLSVQCVVLQEVDGQHSIVDDATVTCSVDHLLPAHVSLSAAAKRRLATFRQHALSLTNDCMLTNPSVLPYHHLVEESRMAHMFHAQVKQLFSSKALCTTFFLLQTTLTLHLFGLEKSNSYQSQFFIEESYDKLDHLLGKFWDVKCLNPKDKTSFFVFVRSVKVKALDSKVRISLIKSTSNTTLDYMTYRTQVVDFMYR